MIKTSNNSFWKPFLDSTVRLPERSNRLGAATALKVSTWAAFSAFPVHLNNPKPSWKSGYRLPVKNKITALHIPRPMPKKAETDPEALPKFLCEMPAFQEDAQLRSFLESQLRFSDVIRAQRIDRNTLQVEGPFRKAAIDRNQVVSKEECMELDPENPLLNTEEPITVGQLNRFGSIDSKWWQWLLEQKPLSFGARIILKKTNDSIQFAKGISLFKSISWKNSGVVFQILFIKKQMNWTLKDLLLLLTKFKAS